MGSTARDDKGQATAELAIVTPIFILLLLAIIQFGGLYNHYESITDATRAGARMAAVSRTSTNPTAIAEQAVRDSAPQLDQSQLIVTVTPSPPWTAGQQVTVSASYPYSISLAGISVTSGTLTATTKERVE